MTISVQKSEESVEFNLRKLNQSYARRDCSQAIAPAIYIIEPTNVCNFRCIMCPTDRIKEKGFMNFENFKHVVDKIRPYAKT